MPSPLQTLWNCLRRRPVQRERIKAAQRAKRRWLFEPLEERRVMAVAFVDPNPSPGNQFGNTVVPLSTGNVVITAPLDDAGGMDAGAVYLFNGSTGDLISTLRGSTDFDVIGNGGVTALSNGNFVIGSPSWHSGGQLVGAATWGSGTTGVAGSISASNSLVGTSGGDSVGSVGNVHALTNGNYVVRTPSWDDGLTQDVGAATWGNGTTGISGPVSIANSLIGTGSGNSVGSHGVKALTNGNYVVISSIWGGGAGAVTFANGSTGLIGTVSSTNSLVGTGANEVGGAGVVEVGNSNYVVLTPLWDNGGAADAGAATWASGTTGITGPVSAANSLVGSVANDHIGMALMRLTNGNYVVRSTDWDNGGALNAGAATWGSATAGVSGVVSAANSLVGSRTGDMVANQIIPLTNGHYVVNSPSWSTASLVQVGAVTWANGTTGRTGLVDATNSLIGTSSQDSVGANNGVVALTNGNYVIASLGWDNGPATNAGAVTWANGTTGMVGTVTTANSLVGTATGDFLGYGGITPLTNGNYVVSSPLWKNASAVAVGAVTWRDGASSTSGTVSAANSLVGSTLQDFVGDIGSVTALTNGNYVAASPNWNGAVVDAGAVTWGNGTTGSSGVISASNSLVGSTLNDKIGNNGIVPLVNGNYVVTSTTWDNGAVVDAGAATWGNGATGSLIGALSPANSLVGSQTSDQVGINGVVALANGNYIVSSANWDNGALSNAGAVSWSLGTNGVVGAVVAPTVNHAKGSTASTSLQPITLDNTNGNFYARFTMEGTGIIRVGSQASGFDVAVPGTLSASFSAGNLIITDIDGVGKDNDLTITRVNVGGTDYYEFTELNEGFTSAPPTAPASTLSNGNKTLRVPVSAISGTLTLNLLAGNDALHVNLTGGDVVPNGGLFFNGSAPAVSPGDRLEIIGGSQGAVTYNYTGVSDGNVVLANFGTITYTSVDTSLINSGATTDITFNFPPSGSTAQWNDDGTVGNGLSRLSSPAFVTTDFMNPSGGITVNRGHTADSLVMTALPDVTAAITIGTNTAQFNVVSISGAITLAANKNFTAFANNTIGLLTSSSDLALSGTGTVALTTTRDITLASGASISTTTGNITLSANQQAAATVGNFVGVDLNNAAITSTSGAITVLGRGGDHGSGQQHGVRANGGSVIGANTTNSVTVNGTGGASAGNDNHGVWVSGTNSAISSGGGTVTVTGTAGGTGSSAFNYGVNLNAGGKIQAASTGNVAVTGTSNTGGGNGNVGVNAFGTGTLITSSLGNVQINGLGGGSGTSVDGWGVFIGTGANATVGGSGTLGITGTGGAGTGGTNHGIVITQAGTLVSTASGALSLLGTPGAGGGTNSFGVNLTDNASVTTANAPINITADSLNIENTFTVSAGTANVTLLQKTNNKAINLGVADSAAQLGISDAELDRVTAGTVIIGNVNTGAMTVGGAITHANHMTLTAASLTVANSLALAANKNLLATMTGSVNFSTASADVSTSGTGTINLTTARDILLSAGSSIITVNGNLNVSANQQATPTVGGYKGIEIAGGVVQSTGSGNVTVLGRGGPSPSTSQQHGVFLNGTGSLITSGGGLVNVTGTGGSTGASTNYGVSVEGGGVISAGGTAAITVNGTGGNTGATTGGNNEGVHLEGAGSSITSSGGAVLVTGQGGGTTSSGNSNGGVIVQTGATIAAGGTGSTTVTGIGGGMQGAQSNIGVAVVGTVSSGGGNVSVTGTGGGSDMLVGSWGVSVSGVVTAGGSGTVTVLGTGSTDVNSAGNRGVLVTGQVTTSGGSLFLTGVGGSSPLTSGNFGVQVNSGGLVAAGGTGVTNVSGTGGPGSAGSNYGVYVQTTGSRIGAGSGGVNIDATVTDSQSVSVFLTTGGTISTTSNGPISIGANGLQIDSPATISAGTGTVILQTKNAGTPIDFGAADVFGTLALTDAELDQVTAGTLIVGNTSSGTVTLSGPITRSAATVTQINSGAAINFTTGSYNSGGGNVLLNPGSVISPATSGVDVTTGAGTLTFGNTDDLSIVINGTNPDTQHQQLNVAGLVNLTGLDLVVSGSYLPIGSETFVIVNNDGTDPVVGTFNGLAEGTLISTNFLGSGLPASVTYVGGTGNDVVINVGGAPGTTTVEVISGNLVVTDAMGGDTNDNLTITRNGANYRISDPINAIQAIAGATQVNANTVDVPFANVTGNLQLNTFAGNDSVTLDFTNGTVLPSGTVFYAAGAGSGDSLILTGGTTTTIAHTSTNVSDGIVTLTGALAGTIVFSGLEPITDSLIAANRTFTFNAGAETITLTNAAGPNQTLGSTLGRNVTFRNPTASLTIDAAAGNDTVTISSVDTDGPFNASLTVNGGTGDDTVNLNAISLNLAPGNNLDVNLQNDDPAPGIDRIVTGFNSQFVLLGSGSATLTASRDIQLQAGTLISTVDGNLTLAANQQAIPTGGDFSGIEASSATLSSSGLGQILVQGRGGDTATSSFRAGLLLIDTVVRSTGSGSVTLQGTGAAGGTGTQLDGIAISGDLADIASHNGNLALTGVGGRSSNGNNTGVRVQNGFVRATGTGTVSITGTGGLNDGSGNDGVQVSGATTRITTASGSLSIIGTGGGSGASGGNTGFDLSAGAQITAGGAGTVTIQGTAGNGTGTGLNNSGISVLNTGSLISSANGNVTVTGTTTNAAGTLSRGVEVLSGAVISAGGTGNLAINGTGGTGAGVTGSFRYGVLVTGAGSQLTSGGGSVTVVGVAGGSGSSSSNSGVLVSGGGVITAGGTGAVSVTGTGGAGSNVTGNNHGVSVSTGGAQITSGGGSVTVTGTAGGVSGSGENHGVFIPAGGTISAGGLGNVIISGVGGNLAGSGSNNHGILVDGGIVSTGGGNITLNGTGAPSSYGVQLDTAANITTQTNGGNIQIATDTLNIIGSATVRTNASGIAIIRPVTATTPIDLGGVDVLVGSPRRLGLTDAELDQVTAGTLQIGDANSGTVTFASPITRTALTIVNVLSGGAINFTTGQLASNGGNVSLNPGTSISPASSGVDINSGTGNITFGSGDDLVINIAGSTLDTQYQRLNVTGAVLNITGLDLLLTGSYTPIVGQTFEIVTNDDVDAIAGTFNGLPEGAIANGNFLGSGLAVTISYVGGTGNDIVLTVISPPNTTTATVTGGNLVVTDILGGDTNDTLTITRVGPDIRIHDPNNRIGALTGATQVDPYTVTVPFASVTGNFQLDTLGGDDSVTIDFAIGNPLPAGGLVYNGGASDSDSLVLSGGLTATISHTLTSATDGNIVLAGDIPGTITYTGVEPITDSLESANRFFTFTSANETITLTDAIGANQMLTGTGGRIITFFNPTAGLTISGAGGNDAITVSSVDTSGPFNASLTINGGTGDDTVTVNTDIGFGSGRNLDLDLQNDDATPGVDSILLGVNTNLILLGAGTAILRASRNVALASGSSIETVNGNLLVEANQQATPTTGAFVGISLDNAALATTGNGQLMAIGRGGNGALGSQLGLSIANGSDIIGGATGLVILTGRGGASPGNTNLGVEITATGTSVTTTGAPIQINGQGDGTGAGTSHPGVVISSGALISAGGTGALTISGTGGSTTGGIHHGVHLNGATVTSGGGNIQIIGQVGANGASGGFDVLLSSSVGTLLTTAGSGGSIAVIGDDLGINGPISTNLANSVTLRQKNNGAALNLGGNLTDAELDLVTTGTLVIGDSNTGPVTISAPITRSAATVININSGSAINFTTGSLNSGGAAVALNPGTSVSPGASGVDINAGTSPVTFGAGDDLLLNIAGTTVDSQYQQLNVVGSVNVTGLDLVITGLTPGMNDSFVIINNDGNDPIVGTFNGLAEGAGVVVNGVSKKLTYVGGDGNDVELLIGITNPPTINSIANLNINEDAGPQLVNFSGITAGAGETQTLSVTATSDSPSIIPNPSVTYTSANTTGSLAFTPVANANGVATITVTVRDSGLDAVLNTADDGLTSTTFTVTVNAVNDAPSFVAGANQVVALNAGPQTVPSWATAITPGPANESSQTVSFLVTDNSNPSMFAVLPTISPTGTLTFTMANNASGVATITVVLQDDGGTSLGGINSSAPQTFTITVGSSNTLRVTNLAVTTTGFIATFNHPLDTAGLNLYDTQGGGIGPADVVLQRATAGFPAVRGSLIVDPAGTSITFVATNGRLAADDYTLTFRSAADGFIDTTAQLLDGDANGLGGDNYVTTFNVAPNTSAVVLSLPNFARGPKQNVNMPANATSGIPMTFSDGSGILTATFEIHYNPALLNITGATVAPGMPAGSFAFLTPTAPGVVEVQFVAAAPLSAGVTRFIDLQANVPEATATYRSKHVIDIQNIQLNDNIPAIDDDAVHVVAYFGDANNSGTYSSADASRISRLAVGLDSGLVPYKLLDPVIIADINGSGAISSADTSRILQVAVGFTIPDVPPLPSPAATLTQGGPDPKLSIPQTLTARPGDALQIPVHIDSIVDLTGTGVDSGDLVMYYDPTVFDVTSVELGSLLAGGSWMVAARIDPLAGRIIVGLAGSQPLEGFFAGELVRLNATVKANAPVGASAINLAANSRDLHRVTQLNDGFLTLIPAPTDAANDPIDGVLTIVAATNAPPTGPNAKLVGDRLVVTGTEGNDRLFIAPLTDGQVRVRSGNRLLGTFPSPSAIAIDALAGADYVVASPQLAGAVIATRQGTMVSDADQIFAGDAATLVDSPVFSDAPGAVPGQPLSSHDLALLQLLDQWVGDGDSVPVGNSMRRRR